MESERLDALVPEVIVIGGQAGDLYARLESGQNPRGSSAGAKGSAASADATATTAAATTGSKAQKPKPPPRGPSACCRCLACVLDPLKVRQLFLETFYITGWRLGIGYGLTSGFFAGVLWVTMPASLQFGLRAFNVQAVEITILLSLLHGVAFFVPPFLILIETGVCCLVCKPMWAPGGICERRAAKPGRGGAAAAAVAQEVVKEPVVAVKGGQATSKDAAKEKGAGAGAKSESAAAAGAQKQKQDKKGAQLLPADGAETAEAPGGAAELGMDKAPRAEGEAAAPGVESGADSVDRADLLASSSDDDRKGKVPRAEGEAAAPGVESGADSADRADLLASSSDDDRKGKGAAAEVGQVVPNPALQNARPPAVLEFLIKYRRSVVLVFFISLLGIFTPVFVLLHSSKNRDNFFPPNGLVGGFLARKTPSSATQDGVPERAEASVQYIAFTLSGIAACLMLVYHITDGIVNGRMITLLRRKEAATQALLASYHAVFFGLGFLLGSVVICLVNLWLLPSVDEVTAQLRATASLDERFFAKDQAKDLAAQDGINADLAKAMVLVRGFDADRNAVLLKSGEHFHPLYFKLDDKVVPWSYWLFFGGLLATVPALVALLAGCLRDNTSNPGREWQGRALVHSIAAAAAAPGTGKGSRLYPGGSARPDAYQPGLRDYSLAYYRQTKGRPASGVSQYFTGQVAGGAHIVDVRDFRQDSWGTAAKPRPGDLPVGVTLQELLERKSLRQSGFHAAPLGNVDDEGDDEESSRGQGSKGGGKGKKPVAGEGEAAGETAVAGEGEEGGMQGGDDQGPNEANDGGEAPQVVVADDETHLASGSDGGDTLNAGAVEVPPATRPSTEPERGEGDPAAASKAREHGSKGGASALEALEGAATDAGEVTEEEEEEFSVALVQERVASFHKVRSAMDVDMAAEKQELFKSIQSSSALSESVALIGWELWVLVAYFFVAGLVVLWLPFLSLEGKYDDVESGLGLDGRSGPVQFESGGKKFTGGTQLGATVSALGFAWKTSLVTFCTLLMLAMFLNPILARVALFLALTQMCDLNFSGALFYFLTDQSRELSGGPNFTPSFTAGYAPASANAIALGLLLLCEGRVEIFRRWKLRTVVYFTLTVQLLSNVCALLFYSRAIAVLVTSDAHLKAASRENLDFIIAHQAYLKNQPTHGEVFANGPRSEAIWGNSAGAAGDRAGRAVKDAEASRLTADVILYLIMGVCDSLAILLYAFLIKVFAARLAPAQKSIMTMLQREKDKVAAERRRKERGVMEKEIRAREMETQAAGERGTGRFGGSDGGGSKAAPESDASAGATWDPAWARGAANATSDPASTTSAPPSASTGPKSQTQNPTSVASTFEYPVAEPKATLDSVISSTSAKMKKHAGRIKKGKGGTHFRNPYMLSNDDYFFMLHSGLYDFATRMVDKNRALETSLFVCFLAAAYFCGMNQGYAGGAVLLELLQCNPTGGYYEDKDFAKLSLACFWKLMFQLVPFGFVWCLLPTEEAVFVKPRRDSKNQGLRTASKDSDDNTGDAVNIRASALNAPEAGMNLTTAAISGKGGVQRESQLNPLEIELLNDEVQSMSPNEAAMLLAAHSGSFARGLHTDPTAQQSLLTTLLSERQQGKGMNSGLPSGSFPPSMVSGFSARSGTQGDKPSFLLSNILLPESEVEETRRQHLTQGSVLRQLIYGSFEMEEVIYAAVEARVRELLIVRNPARKLELSKQAVVMRPIDDGVNENPDYLQTAEFTGHARYENDSDVEEELTEIKYWEMDSPAEKRKSRMDEGEGQS